MKERVAMMSRRAGVLTILMLIATCIASCSSKQAQPPNLASMQLSTAAPGSCQIDAVKMCQATGGTAAPQAEQKATMPMQTYGPPNLPDSIEFQIPAGQNIKLMCYYDPQHTSVYRADATPDAPLTDNSVEYMKKQGFCVNK
jgi:hypothetical protein